jgi:hypothetical protein
MALPPILLGAILLLFGRRLFWLFVGAAGFVAGLTFARQFFASQPDWIILAIALVAGVIGAVLSIFLQQIAIAVAGFLIGGYVLATFVAAAGYPAIGWPAYLVGGLIGAVLVVVLFDWALIVLSSLAGAMLIAESTAPGQTLAVVIFVAAFVIGVVMQRQQLTPAAPAP